jgi:hypothetical protein
MEEMQKITCIQDLINWNNSNSDKGARFLFRGMADKSYQLIPKLSRTENGEVVSEEVASKRREKLREYLTIRLPAYGFDFQGMGKIERTWKELFIAQHYGVPTQLLDFTRNPMTALFFACEQSPKKDGILFSVGIKAQEVKSKEEFNAAKPDYNIASYDLLAHGANPLGPYNLGGKHKFVVPPQLDNRIKSQDSVFCCFPPEQLTVTLEKQVSWEYEGGQVGEGMNWINSWVIPSSSKSSILQELNRIGINHSTLFPDVHGLGAFVTWKLFNIKD